MNTSRIKLRQQFIAKHGWGDGEILPLKSDASYRQYFRLRRYQTTVLLMDAKPPLENVDAFIKVTRHLQKIGVRVPDIHQSDSDNGFLLLEDLGDQTFTQSLMQGHAETELYEQAINTLSRIQQHPQATKINLPSYSSDIAVDEANLLVDWYLPARLEKPTSPVAKQRFQQTWKEILNALPPLKPTLVLRDYHVDNLMRDDDDCALLDYQDAVIGSPAYDLVSLLEDARRDIDQELADNMLDCYLKQNCTIDQHALEQHRIVWSAQRHCKVAGIFVRLWLRDGKDSYLKHLPRVMNLLQRHLHEPALQPLSDWLKNHLSELNHVDFPTDANAKRLARFCNQP